jgi:hypothetical protein
VIAASMSSSSSSTFAVAEDLRPACVESRRRRPAETVVLLGLVEDKEVDTSKPRVSESAEDVVLLELRGLPGSLPVCAAASPTPL